MSDIPRRIIVKSLTSKGFVKFKPGSDHDWYVFVQSGRKFKQIMAKISRGSDYKTYPEALWKRMKTRLQLSSNEEVRNLLSCPMDSEEYSQILKNQNLI